MLHLERDGCRPFVEVFVNDSRIASTSTEYERLRHYNRATDSCVYWKDLKACCDIHSDVLIIIYHARSSLGARVLQTKMMSMLTICSIQFVPQFELKSSQNGTQTINFSTSQLTGLEEMDRYPREFSVSIEMELTNHSAKEKNDLNLFQSVSSSNCLFSSEAELEECQDLFNISAERQKSSFCKPKESPKPARPPPPFSSSSESSLSFAPTVPPHVTNKTQTSDSASLSQAKPNLGKIFSNNFEWCEKESQPMSSDSHQGEKVGDLLNFSKDESHQTNKKNNSETNRNNGNNKNNNKIINADIASVDLLIDATSECNLENSSSHSNVDLLNDLFTSSDNKFQSHIKQPEAKHSSSNLPQPDLLIGEPFTSSNFNPYLHRNTSTPNLTQLDPLGDPLGPFVNFSTTTPTLDSAPPLKPQIPRVSSCTFQPFSTTSKPDYSRSNFTDMPNQSSTSSGPKVLGNEFEDLLSGFPKRPQPENTNKSLAEMKKQDMVNFRNLNSLSVINMIFMIYLQIKEGIDPVKLKIMQWKENKTRNIRALLGSLHTIVWDDCNWQSVGIHQLMNPSDVKKMYRKACLAVHPDKVIQQFVLHW